MWLFGGRWFAEDGEEARIAATAGVRRDGSRRKASNAFGESVNSESGRRETRWLHIADDTGAQNSRVSRLHYRRDVDLCG